jgi:hypothetical protein
VEPSDDHLVMRQELDQLAVERRRFLGPAGAVVPLRKGLLGLEQQLGVVLAAEHLDRALEHLDIARVTSQQRLEQHSRPAAVVGSDQHVDHRHQRCRLEIDVPDLGDRVGVELRGLQAESRAGDQSLEYGTGLVGVARGDERPGRRPLQRRTGMTDGQRLPRELGRFVGAVRVDQRVEARSDKVRVGRLEPQRPQEELERLVEAALRDQALSERLDLAHHAVDVAELDQKVDELAAGLKVGRLVLDQGPVDPAPPSAAAGG